MIASFAYIWVKPRRGKAKPLGVSGIPSHSLGRTSPWHPRFISSSISDISFLNKRPVRRIISDQNNSAYLSNTVNPCPSVQPPVLSVERWADKYIGRLSWDTFSPNAIYCVWFKSIYTLWKLKSILLFAVWLFVLTEFAFTMKRLQSVVESFLRSGNLGVSAGGRWGQGLGIGPSKANVTRVIFCGLSV